VSTKEQVTSRMRRSRDLTRPADGFKDAGVSASAGLDVLAGAVGLFGDLALPAVGHDGAVEALDVAQDGPGQAGAAEVGAGDVGTGKVGAL